MFKYKKFVDEEATIIGLTDGTGREEGKAILIVRDIAYNEFPVRPRGSFSQREQWCGDTNLLGLPVTIRYFELSEYSIPRFPVAIAIRDYESIVQRASLQLEIMKAQGIITEIQDELVIVETDMGLVPCQMRATPMQWDQYKKSGELLGRKVEVRHALEDTRPHAIAVLI